LHPEPQSPSLFCLTLYVTVESIEGDESVTDAVSSSLLLDCSLLVRSRSGGGGQEEEW